MTPAQTLCQTVADTHYAIAFHDGPMAFFDHPVYRASQRCFIAAIRQAYGLSALKARRVYAVWVDCAEPIAYCVDYVQHHRESRLYSL